MSNTKRNTVSVSVYWNTDTTRWKSDRKKKRKLRRKKKLRKGMSVGEILKLQIPQRKKSEKRKRRKILPVYTEKSSKAH